MLSSSRAFLQSSSTFAHSLFKHKQWHTTVSDRFHNYLTCHGSQAMNQKHVLRANIFCISIWMAMYNEELFLFWKKALCTEHVNECFEPEGYLQHEPVERDSKVETPNSKMSKFECIILTFIGRKLHVLLCANRKCKKELYDKRSLDLLAPPMTECPVCPVHRHIWTQSNCLLITPSTHSSKRHHLISELRTTTNPDIWLKIRAGICLPNSAK